MGRTRPATVSLEALDLSDETFRCSYGRSTEDLERSIDRFGLICPPKVQPRGGRFRVVSGFVRIEAARRCGIPDTPMTVVEEDSPENDLLLQVLEENRFCRGFNWAERAMVLSRVAEERRTARSWILRHAMPALGLHSSEKILDDHLRCAQIPDAAKRVMIRHGCSTANAVRLTRWPLEQQPVVVPLLEELHLGENLLRECLERLYELWLRDGTLPQDFITQPEGRAILCDPDRSRPQKAQAFRMYLRDRRLPSLSAMEEAFRKARSHLHLIPGVSLQADPYFEEEGIRIAFRARTPRELRSLAEGLREAAGKDDQVQHLFEVIKIKE